MSRIGILIYATQDVKRAEELFQLVEACNEITPEQLQVRAPLQTVVRF